MECSCGIGAAKRAITGLCGAFNCGLGIDKVILPLCPCFVHTWEIVPLSRAVGKLLSDKIKLFEMAVSHSSKMGSAMRAAFFWPSLRRLTYSVTFVGIPSTNLSWPVGGPQHQFSPAPRCLMRGGQSYLGGGPCCSRSLCFKTPYPSVFNCSED